MRQRFAKGFDFPPLSIWLGEADVQRPKNDDLDAILAVSSGEQAFEFAAEFKARNSPRIFEDALAQIERAAARRNMLPMLVVPYLRESQLVELQQRQRSGIDLSGNGVVIIPGKLFVYRTGAPNKFPDSTPSRFAYRGATSLVPRVFLCRPKFQSLAEISAEIKSRGGSVALSTISKAIKRMEDDLIIDRISDGWRTRQPDKLLQKLRESYAPPKVSNVVTLKFKKDLITNMGIREATELGPLAKRVLLAKLMRNRMPLQKDVVVLTGTSSIPNYAIMGRQDWPVLYTPNADKLLQILGENVEPASRFIDLELRQTDDPTVYFDARNREDLPYASPIQVFLECSAGDKREQETALQVKDLILRELQEMKLGKTDGSRSAPDNSA